MTMIETETIGCPACKVEQEVDVYQTINAMENPELVQKLMAGEITSSHAPHAAMRLRFNAAVVQRLPNWLEDSVLPGTRAEGKSGGSMQRLSRHVEADGKTQEGFRSVYAWFGKAGWPYGGVFHG